MGASEWAYFVPYQPDIAAAMREAQHEEFSKRFEGRVSREAAIAEQRRRLDDPVILMIYPDAEDQKRAREAIEENIRHLESWPQPTNIDEQIAELLFMSAEEGTGTILDMEGTSDYEEYFKISPVASFELISLFNTDKPDHDMIVEKRHDIMDLRESQKGIYVIVYKDGQPDEIFFGGCSGD